MPTMVSKWSMPMHQNDDHRLTSLFGFVSRRKPLVNGWNLFYINKKNKTYITKHKKSYGNTNSGVLNRL